MTAPWYWCYNEKITIQDEKIYIYCLENSTVEDRERIFKNSPLLGLSDGIVDIVETGATLRENGLEVVERINQVSARLIVNAASLKLRKQEIENLAARLEREIRKGEGT